MGKSLVSCFFDSRCRIDHCDQCDDLRNSVSPIAYCYLMLIYPSTFWDSKMSISLRAE